MHLLFLLCRIYPYLAVPTALLSAELTFILKRKNKKSYLFLGVMAIWNLLTSLLWIVFRGDLYSDIWVKSLLAALRLG